MLQRTSKNICFFFGWLSKACLFFALHGKILLRVFMPVSKMRYKSLCVPPSGTEDQQESDKAKVKERGKDRAQKKVQQLIQSSQQFFHSSSLKVFTSPISWSTKDMSVVAQESKLKLSKGLLSSLYLCLFLLSSSSLFLFAKC